MTLNGLYHAEHCIVFQEDNRIPMATIFIAVLFTKTQSSMMFIFYYYVELHNSLIVTEYDVCRWGIMWRWSLFPQ